MSTYFQKRRESFFFDYVKDKLYQAFTPREVRRGGLRVYTTIDLKKQEAARAAIRKNLGAPGSPAAAIVSIDPKTGWIKAMATSQTYSKSKFNIASQGKRQPGSTFKIIVLMTALRRNVDINKTYYMSKPLKLNWHGFQIDVTNSDGKASGHAKSLFEAVVSSDNTVFQQLDLDMGPENVTKTAHDMGITSRLDSYPAEGLGGAARCCTPLEMARAFVTVNDGGSRKKPIAITKVKFPDGKTDYSLARTQSKKIFTDGQTYQAIQAMKANAQRGTGTAANLGFCPTAGKTGTTSGFKDAWFNGMTSNLNTTVWVGYPNANLPMTAVPNWGTMFGGDAPASIWHDFMTAAVNRDTCKDWPKPTTPFVGEPFFGEFTVGGSRAGDGIYDENGDTQTTPDGGQQDGLGTGDGGTQYPPDKFESPPQGSPTTGQGTGTGNGVGTGTGNGVGNGTTGTGQGNGGTGNGQGTGNGGAGAGGVSPTGR
jgi:penicillin-binding protein 1A